MKHAIMLMADRKERIPVYNLMSVGLVRDGPWERWRDELRETLVWCHDDWSHTP